MAPGRVDPLPQTEAVSAKAPKNLFQLLTSAARESGDRGLKFYRANNVNKVAKTLSYADLLKTATSNAKLLNATTGIAPGCTVLIHMDNHVDNIEWMWAVLACGHLPVISTPFSNDNDQRKRHLLHLHRLLKNPVVLTKKALVPDFSTVNMLNIQTIEDIRQLQPKEDEQAATAGLQKDEEDVGILMLTSGSTGNAKGVCLRHGQLLRALKGKSLLTGTSPSDVFINWIGLDHVANLTETHLHAMSLGAEQVHVQAADLLANPLSFLDLVDKHRAMYSFAPNFFLASLRKALDNPDEEKSNWDLSCLTSLISGGEANVVETATALTQQLQKYGAPADFIRPGFGMTETCAGSIYSKECPSYDVKNGWEFASLGQCIPGLQMRVMLDNGLAAPPNEVGSLELFGPVLFRDYYNNPSATRDSFTTDGWFITGDRAFIDPAGRMCLSGRAKETIIINGVKYFPHEVETAVEEAGIDGAAPAYTAVFPHRPKGSQTEVLCVTYLPTFAPDDIESRVKTTDEITKVTILQCGVKPYKIIPLPIELLPKTTLGKLSRAKIRNAFEAGKYNKYADEDEKLIKDYRLARVEKPKTDMEQAVLECFADLFEVSEEEIGVNTSLYEMGVSSIEIIKLATFIRRRLNLEQEVPVISIMTNPTIRGTAKALEKLQAPHVYEPVVCLQPGGDKVPLFLIHPGVGEILVFLNLAKYITDRPVYAIRARGFDGEEYHKDIPEIVECYHKGIKEAQPTGPYALAGYSYGAMLAFETGKLLEANGDEVKFLGSFNLPPNIKMRMRQLDWIEVFLNLSYFLDLISDDYAHAISPDMHKLSHSEVLDFVMSKAPPERMEEMALTKEKLANWTSLSHWLHCIAHHYDPSGTIASIDVFYAIPLQAVAKDKTSWLDNHLNKWQEYVREDVRFTEVDGAHYTMMSPTHVGQLQKKIKDAMTARGI